MVITTVSSLALLIGYLTLYRRHAHDLYREELFSLRDRLFNLGLEENDFQFTNPLYGALERLINNNIRFTHRISFAGTLAFNVLNQLRYPGIRVQTNLSAEVDARLGSLRRSPVSDELKKIRAALETQTVFLLLRTSPLFVAYVAALFLRFALKDLSRRVRLRSQVKNVIVRGVNQEIEYQAESYAMAS